MLQFTLFPEEKVAESLVGKVFHASWGYDATNNTFITVLKETEKTVIVAELKRQQITGDLTAGTERPIPGQLGNRVGTKQEFRLHKRYSKDGTLFFQDDYKIFHLWDGKDTYFNGD